VRDSTDTTSAFGEGELAYSWLDRGFDARTIWMTWPHLDPRLKRLRGTPRFEALVEQVRMVPRARSTGVDASMSIAQRWRRK
jgi:hypothetical protein